MIRRRISDLEQIRPGRIEPTGRGPALQFAGTIAAGGSQQQRDRLRLAEGAEAALLSGSGATVFGVFRDETAARQAQASFQTEPHLKVYAVSTPSDF